MTGDGPCEDGPSRLCPLQPTHGAGAVARGDQAILIVDDDRYGREAVALAFEHRGFKRVAVTSGAGAPRLCSLKIFDFIICEFHLGGGTCVDVFQTLHRTGALPPFVVTSATLTVPAVVAAMKLGALDVLEKPVSVDQVLPHLATIGTRRMSGARQSLARLPDDRNHPGSAVDRWVNFIICACTSEADLKTLEHWAHYVAVSQTSLCENCRVLGVGPRESRDLMRVLRALMLSAVRGCPPDVLLDVCDRRTLKALCDRAGLPASLCPGELSVDDYLQRQRFVSSSHEAVKSLRARCAGQPV